MSNYDPFEPLRPDAPTPRRRDLREKSTARSRRAARRRANVERKARLVAKKEVARCPSGASKPRKTVGKRIWSGLVSLVALSLAAAFALATVGSPLLFSSASATAASATTNKSKTTLDSQALKAAPGKEQEVDRGDFQELSAAELYEMEVGGLSYTVNNTGVIRWPFNYPVPINSPFGPRVAPCPGCSTFHRGTDFGTGDDAPIYAVAVGVVTQSEMQGSYGQYVAVSSDINGKKFTAIYAHMTAGSETVQVGAKVTEGEILGLTGDTGESTGPHLDFEIDINGVAVDSFVWLKENTA